MVICSVFSFMHWWRKTKRQAYWGQQGIQQIQVTHTCSWTLSTWVHRNACCSYELCVLNLARLLQIKYRFIFLYSHTIEPILKVLRGRQARSALISVSSLLIEICLERNKCSFDIQLKHLIINWNNKTMWMYWWKPTSNSSQKNLYSNEFFNTTFALVWIICYHKTFGWNLL